MALQDYKCPCCGGSIEFNSNVGKMKCPFCDSEFEMDSLKELDQALENDIKEEMNWDMSAGDEFTDAEQGNLAAYKCSSCAAEIITDKTTGASSCPYCGNAIVVMGNFSGALKPDLIIPFKYDKNAAKEALSKHFEGKKLLPSAFKNSNHIDEIQGVYAPFWLYDTEAQASITYKAVKERTYSDNDYNYVEKKYYTAIRRGKLAFDNVPVDGSKKLDDALMDSIEPYNFDEGVDFQTAYLAGYLADKYDVSVEECAERANKRIKSSTEQTFRNTVKGYTTVDTESSNIKFSNGRTRYAMLPMWILNTSWNNQNFVFCMNGQTGKMVGNLPCDKSKFWKNFFLVFAIAAIATAGIATLLGSGFSAGKVIAGVIVGLIISGIYSLILKGELKSVALKSEATNYIKKDSLQFAVNSDFYMYTKVDRTARPKPQTQNSQVNR